MLPQSHLEKQCSFTIKIWWRYQKHLSMEAKVSHLPKLDCGCVKSRVASWGSRVSFGKSLCLMVICDENNFLHQRGTLFWVSVPEAQGLGLGLYLSGHRLTPGSGRGVLIWALSFLGPPTQICLSIRVAYWAESDCCFNWVRDQGSSSNYSQDKFEGTGSMEILSH